MTAPIDYMYDENGRFTGQKTRQIDPLESKQAGQIVYVGASNNSTEIPVLEEKEGFDRYFTNGKWEYREKKKDHAPEPYTPTRLEELYNEYYELKSQFVDTDWMTIKIQQAVLFGTPEEVEELKSKYADKIAETVQWRERINELEIEIAAEKVKTESTNS